MENWHLRDATVADYGFIFRVYRETMRDYIDEIWRWDDTAQRQHYEQSFRSDDYQVIQLDGVDVGVLSIYPREDYDFLARLEVMPEHQNQGLGTAILTHLIDRAKAKTTPIMLRVFKINRAQNLYERLGFQIIRQDEIHYDMLYAQVDK